jgi:excisionase family DNA binding protein
MDVKNQINRNLPLDDLPFLLSIQEFQKYTHISRSLAYKLVGDGLLPSFRLGRRILIRRDALIDFIEDRQECDIKLTDFE